jgi:NAD(P)-dependent dehydrogenase (short-subunit alcohol dehydrogenase family)
MIEPSKGPGGTAPRKVALVTGASRGLGLTLAHFLAGQGFALVLTARGAPELERAAREVRGKADSGAVVAIAGDVTEEDHRGKLVAGARDFGGLDILVNNASELGPSPLVPLNELPLAALRHVFDVNVAAPLALVQAALPLLVNSRGLVVNVSSDAAVGGYPGWGAYGASKAALDLFSKTLAEELRAKGVAVVSVDPGDMRTKMHQDAYPGQDISDRPLPEVTLPFWAWLLGQEPLRASGARYQAQAAVWEVPG